MLTGGRPCSEGYFDVSRISRVNREDDYEDNDEVGRCRAEQVDPIEPTLKAPGTDRLKLKYDVPPFKFAFKFNLRRYNEEEEYHCGGYKWHTEHVMHACEVDIGAEVGAGAYTRPLLSST